MSEALRGRSPRGRVSRGFRTLSQGHEPPQDLRELRAVSPNVRWGSNLAAAGEDPALSSYSRLQVSAQQRDAEDGLPEAYLQAIRMGDYTSTQVPRRTRSRGHDRYGTRDGSSSAAAAATATTPRAMYTRPAGKSPWRVGNTTGAVSREAQYSGLSGVFSTPGAPPERRTPRSELYPNRPWVSKSPAGSSRLSASAQSGTHAKPAFRSMVGPSSKTFGGLLTTAAPVKKEKAKKVPVAERSLYSKAGRRRTPSPRPGTHSTSAKPDGRRQASATAGKRTERLAKALEDRASLERDMKHSYVDPTRTVAPELDEYLQEIHHPSNYYSPRATDTAHHSPPRQPQQDAGLAADESLPPPPESPTSPRDIMALSPTYPPTDVSFQSALATAAPEEEDADQFAGWTPLHWAAKKGQLELLRVRSPPLTPPAPTHAHFHRSS